MDIGSGVTPTRKSRRVAVAALGILAVSGILVATFGTDVKPAPHKAPCAGITASPWLDTVGGQTYVCTTTGPVAIATPASHKVATKPAAVKVAKPAAVKVAHAAKHTAAPAVADPCVDPATNAYFEPRAASCPAEPTGYRTADHQ